jgi:hypothetical protein
MSRILGHPNPDETDVIMAKIRDMRGWVTGAKRAYVEVLLGAAR